MTNRAAILGCKSTTRYLYKQLRDELPIQSVVTISPRLAEKHEVADYDDLRDLCSETEVFVVDTYALSSSGDQDFFRNSRFDFLLVAGWQRLVPQAVLETLRVGAFGMHGSSRNLPFGRGRSPLNWSILEGRGWFFTNLFRYQVGIDDGPIVDTACFSINGADTAETLHFKNLLAMVDLVRRNREALLSGRLEVTPQGPGVSTYYPKRNPDDGIIDWRQDVFAIDRHIRAVAPPFFGAFSYIDEARYTITRASIFYTDLEAHPFHGQPPGSICAVLPNGKFCVRAEGGVLIVHEFEGERSGVVEGARFRSPAELIRAFPRNEAGHFDLPAPRSEPDRS